MKKLWSVAVGVLMVQAVAGQNSILVNFGSTTCTAINQPMFALIKDPLSNVPLVLNNCSMSGQVPDIFSVFVAYNPKDNKLYIADVRTFNNTRSWQLDVGLPGNIACPASIPTTPTYTNSYVSNNYEFDNNGDLWSLSNYNVSTGQCSMDKFDVASGNVLSSRVLQFPTGRFPTAITTGDITILPNGRMFATLGSGPSRLYEILNYNGNQTATAQFLTELPNTCFGLAYLNGKLAITGSNLGSDCYFFEYDISSGQLGAQKPFLNGQSPIDNTSITPALGATKRLVNAWYVSPGVADVEYEIYVRNMGNVVLNEINVIEDLAAVFGVNNISNVQVSFVPGSNGAGLSLNPQYNGITQTSMLASGQNLPNAVGAAQNFSFKLQLRFRASNVQPNTNYLNSARARATINNAVDPVVITDSSNNGTESMVDPDNDGNATEAGENVPTPFNLQLLPVKFTDVQAQWQGKTDAWIGWQVATPVRQARHFEVQRSTNGNGWTTVAQLPITDAGKSRYAYTDVRVPAGALYYRIRQTDIDGATIYSKVVTLYPAPSQRTGIPYPNPAHDALWIHVPQQGTAVSLIDGIGRTVWSNTMQQGMQRIATGHLPQGHYRLLMRQGTQVQQHAVQIQHR